MQQERTYFVYIMASRSGVLYCGVTNSIRRRNAEHKSRRHDGFTARYRCTRLVYYEIYRSIHNAIAREKQIKRWRRDKKVALIEQANPRWLDLSDQWDKPIPPYNATLVAKPGANPAPPAPQPPALLPPAPPQPPNN
jgi:putative endonuclease